MDSLEVIGYGAPLVAIMVQFLKKEWPKVNPRIWAGALCVAVGLGYSLSITFLPLEVLEIVTKIGGLTFVAATYLYKLVK